MPSATKYRKYISIGAMTLTASGAVAIYLNLQGFRCLSDLVQVDRFGLTLDQLEGMESRCAIITNSYVYSVYGVIIGIILIIIGLVKKRNAIRAF